MTRDPDTITMSTFPADLIFISQLQAHVGRLPVHGEHRSFVSNYDTAANWFQFERDPAVALDALAVALRGIDAENTIRLATEMTRFMRVLTRSHIALLGTDLPGALGPIAFGAVYGDLVASETHGLLCDRQDLPSSATDHWSHYVHSRLATHDELSPAVRDLAYVIAIDWRGTLDDLLCTVSTLCDARLAPA